MTAAPQPAPQPTVTLTGTASRERPLELLFRAAQLSTHFHTAVLQIDHSVAPLQVVPDAAHVVATYQGDGGAELLAEDGGVMLHVEAYGDTVSLTAAGADLDAVARMVEQIAAAHGEATSDCMRVGIWHANLAGRATLRHVQLTTRRWVDIARNYPDQVRGPLENLVRRGGADLDGPRLVLFHGPPGTGKTNAIRAVFRAWRRWCEPHVVTDPDRMFANADYLDEVLNAATRSEAAQLTVAARPRRWKLVVAEDADAYLRASARRDAGAALGRLLNTTDGILGQSHPVLILLTTNEELARLHPALTRPGRCLGAVEFDRFDRRQAQTWLGASAHAPSDGATLAELYQLLATGCQPEPTATTGAYL